MKKSKLPSTDSIQELAEFWDTHDFTDFEDEFEGVTEPVFVRPSGDKSQLRTISNQQTTGNIGLFYVCYRLSRLGWNVMPTARNARGIDIVVYSQDASRKWTIQVKTLSKASPVPLSNRLDHLFADFIVVCRHVIREIPECFILTPTEIRRLAHRGEKNGKVSFWLQPRDYATDQFREKWERIGWGLSEKLAREVRVQRESASK